MARRETDPDTGNERYYQEVRSRGGVIFICGAAAAFGLLCLLGGFAARLPHVGADEYGMLVFGLVFCLLAWRFWNITTGPYVILSPSRLTVRKMLRTRSWKFEDITALASFPTIVQADLPKGRKGPKVPVHYLGIKTRDGKFAQAVLPENCGNQTLLKSLSENSLVKITEIEGEKDALKEWGKRPS
jgi:hypothetical protein